MPPASTMWVEFGIDAERLQGRQLEARFRITVASRGDEPKTILDVSLDETSESLWRGRRLPLARYTYQRVEMCVSTEVSGEMENPEDMVAWGNPLVQSPIQHPSGELSEEQDTAREKKLREQQLRALGYVN